jgi:hypothetical protein
MHKVDVRAIGIDLHVAHHQFISGEGAEGLIDACTSGADAFDLRTHQHHAAFVGVQQVVLKTSPPVLHFDLRCRHAVAKLRQGEAGGRHQEDHHIVPDRPDIRRLI